MTTKQDKTKIIKALLDQGYQAQNIDFDKHQGWIIDNYPVGYEPINFIKEWWIKEEAGNCFADPQNWIIKEEDYK